MGNVSGYNEGTSSSARSRNDRNGQLACAETPLVNCTCEGYARLDGIPERKRKKLAVCIQVESVDQMSTVTPDASSCS